MPKAKRRRRGGGRRGGATAAAVTRRHTRQAAGASVLSTSLSADSVSQGLEQRQPESGPTKDALPLSVQRSQLTFSDLVFHEKLGEGGYGVVTRVTFTKPYLGLKQAAAKSVKDLKEEVDILKDLDHPNVVNLYGCVEGPMSLKVILLEYAPHGTVRDYLTKHQGARVSIGLLKKWSKESALALQYLHQKRLLHRDVKASNCLLFEDNLLKLSDFGLAREMVDSITTSTAKGTWRYMAPEIHTEDHFSFKSDIYAFGMLVLEIGTGAVPFEDKESVQVVYRVCTEHLKPTIPVDFPEALADFINRCWSPTPKYRPSLTEALEVISGLPDESDTTQPLGEAASTSSGAHSVRQWRLVKEFGKEGDAEGEFQKNGAVAVCHNGDIAVVDFPNWADIKGPPRRAYMFTNNGKFKYTLNPPEGNPKAHMTSPHEVAVTSQGHIVVTDSKSKYVKLFNEKGTYLHSFSVLSDNDNPDTQVSPFSVTVSSTGDILIGEVNRKVITIHEPHDGRLHKVVKLDIKPHFLATNSHQEHILVCDWQARKVHAVNYAGDVLFTLGSFMDDGKPSVPLGLVCDESNHIYIAVRNINDTTGGGMTDTGHIHQYSCWGRFMRCIIKGMYSPHGITLHNDALYVANTKSVLIYSQE